MKVVLISPFTNALESEILYEIEHADADLILLPGFCKNMPTPQKIQSVIKLGVSVFVEHRGEKCSAIPSLVTKDNIHDMPRQVFINKPSNADIERLLTCLQQRTFTICDRKVTFLICGEIMLFNPNGEVKYNQNLPFSIDVLANPCHTIMGHWNHLGNKFINLSKKNTLVLYVTNNNKNHHRITTNVRIYKNGVLSGDKTEKQNITCLKLIDNN